VDRFLEHVLRGVGGSLRRSQLYRDAHQLPQDPCKIICHLAQHSDKGWHLAGADCARSALGIECGRFAGKLGVPGKVEG